MEILNYKLFRKLISGPSKEESLSETISQIIDECFVADGEDSDYIKIEEFVEWGWASINYSVDNSP